MERVLNMTYASSLTGLCELNSSFDTGVLRVAYPGENQNRSAISKEAFERCIDTIYNCPIVCNYDRESDTFGGHDMEVVRSANGDYRLVNLTTPVGCVPESAKHWWGMVTEDDGTEHEYLYVEVLLWKRQEPYFKIKSDGIVAHSMEIAVKDGEVVDGIYMIRDFEFTAFALIGCTPCFESSALEMFSKKDFKQQFSEMMLDLKESFTAISTPNGDDDTHPQENLTEGGEKVLDKDERAVEAGEDLETKDTMVDGEPANTETDADGNDNPEVFALNSQMVCEISRTLREIATITTEWGEFPRYMFVDCDLELCEIYCWDAEDWLLYGFTYQMDGDQVVIDLESKNRKKYAIVDFDEGDQLSPFAEVFGKMKQKIQEDAELGAKYQEASNTIESIQSELNDLRAYKAEKESNYIASKKNDIFSQFDDLSGNEAFEELRSNMDKYGVEELEDKCFSIRGRVGVPAKFSFEGKPSKTVVDRTDTDDEPYGGLVKEYLGR